MASNKLRTRIVYTSEAVDNMTDAEVRAAYTSIRHIAVERFKRLGAKGYSNTQTYVNAVNIGAFPPISSLTAGQVRQTLIDTSLWLRSPYSKVTRMNQRNRQAAASFRKMGYKFINKSNINEFLNFLNDMQEAYGEKNYGYEKIASAYEQAMRLQIPEEDLRANFDKWMQNLNAIREIEPSDNGEANAKKVRSVLKKARKKK